MAIYDSTVLKNLTMWFYCEPAFVANLTTLFGRISLVPFSNILLLRSVHRSAPLVEYLFAISLVYRFIETIWFRIPARRIASWIRYSIY